MTNREYYKDDPLALHRAWKNRKNKETSFETFLKLEHSCKNVDAIAKEAIVFILGQVASKVNEINSKVDEIKVIVETLEKRK